MASMRGIHIGLCNTSNFETRFYNDLLTTLDYLLLHYNMYIHICTGLDKFALQSSKVVGNVCVIRLEILFYNARK